MSLTIQLQILTIYGHKEVTIFDEFTKILTPRICVVELSFNRLITSIYIIECIEIDSRPLSMSGELVTKKITIYSRYQVTINKNFDKNSTIEPV